MSDHTCPQCKALFGPLSLYKIVAYDGQEMRAKLRCLYLSGKKPTANQIKYLVAASIDDKSLIKLTDPFKYGSTLLHWCAIFSLVQEGKILLGKVCITPAAARVERQEFTR